MLMAHKSAHCSVIHTLGCRCCNVSLKNNWRGGGARAYSLTKFNWRQATSVATLAHQKLPEIRQHQRQWEAHRWCVKSPVTSDAAKVMHPSNWYARAVALVIQQKYIFSSMDHAQIREFEGTKRKEYLSTTRPEVQFFLRSFVVESRDPRAVGLEMTCELGPNFFIQIRLTQLARVQVPNATCFSFSGDTRLGQMAAQNGQKLLLKSPLKRKLGPNVTGPMITGQGWPGNLQKAHVTFEKLSVDFFCDKNWAKASRTISSSSERSLNQCVISVRKTWRCKLSIWESTMGPTMSTSDNGCSWTR